MKDEAARVVRAFSLRTLLLLLVFVTTFPALLVATLLARRVIADNREAVEGQLIEAARAEASIVDAELDGTIRVLEGLAQSDQLTRHELESFHTQATRLMATQPTWSAVSLSMPDGRQVVNTQVPSGAPLPPPSDLDTFRQVVRMKMPAVGNLRVGNISRNLGFPVRVPVVREGSVVYVVSAWITSANFGEVLRRQGTLSDEWVQTVVDGGGALVARSNDSEHFAGQKLSSGLLHRFEATGESAYRGTSVDGTPVYGALSRGATSHWIAAVEVPAAIANASFRQLVIVLGSTAVLLLSFGCVGTYLISSGISREISRASADADAIAGGAHPSGSLSRVSEVQRLLDGLARSSALLEARQEERDEHVARADSARREAEEADRAKDQFLAMLGHELRNPLAPALTALQLMKGQNGSDTTRERDVIERQIRHMARLVDDLLDVSRLRRGAIELRREVFELGEASVRAVEMTTTLFGERHHKLDVDVPAGLVLDADRTRIAQVLSNLLSNAAKYTEPGGNIVLRARRDRDHVVVECRDDGIGMSGDLVPHVFDLFVQGPRGLDRRQGGLGLGLAVARTLVELHGGTIEARSAGVNQGSMLVVRLPLAGASAVPAARSKEKEIPMLTSDRAPFRRVLVVDDNHDALEMLVEVLTRAGFEVFGAALPSEALNLTARVAPQAAVLDIGLPEMDGFDLARAIRSLEAGASMRLIALTGYGRQQDMTAAQAAGFDAFLVKPVDFDSLFDALSGPSEPVGFEANPIPPAA